MHCIVSPLTALIRNHHFPFHDLIFSSFSQNLTFILVIGLEAGHSSAYLLDSKALQVAEHLQGLALSAAGEDRLRGPQQEGCHVPGWQVLRHEGSPATSALMAAMQRHTRVWGPRMGAPTCGPPLARSQQTKWL